MSIASKTYTYNIAYKLNFVPGVLLYLALFIAVFALPSTNKAPGYIFVTFMSCFFAVLVYRERKAVSTDIIVSDQGLIASNLNAKCTTIYWGDIASLRYSGKGVYLVSWKLEKYLYAEIVSARGDKIVIRREIQGYGELIDVIESSTNKRFASI